MTEQFGRRASLRLASATQELDLSELRFRFKITQSDIQTPNNAVIRVWNLKNETARIAEKEFTRVVIQAGYQSETQYGTIFDGEIKQTRRGREQGSTVDTYIDILAAEDDVALLNTFLSEPLEGASTQPGKRMDGIIKAMQKVRPEVRAGFVMDLPPQVAARGKIQWGLVLDEVRSIEATYNARFSTQGNKVNLIPLDGYIPNEVSPAVVLNAATGLIGRPEVTQEGIKVRCLLNPNIVVGGLVRINNKAVEDLLLSGEIIRRPGRLDDAESNPLAKPIVPDGDGFYKVLVCEFVGDTRGLSWYNELICLALTAPPPGGKVAAHS